MSLELRKCLIHKGKRGKPNEIESFPLDADVEFNHYGLYKREANGQLLWASDYDLKGKQITDHYHYR